jgi:hypothetical protein
MKRLFALALLGALVSVALTPLACKTSTSCSDPKNAASAQCNVLNALVDCTGVKTLDATIAEVAPAVISLIGTARNADGSINWPSIEPTLIQLAWKYGMCVIAEIWNDYFGPTSVPIDAGVVADAGSAATPVDAGSAVPVPVPAIKKLRVDMQAAQAEFERIRARVAPGTHFKVKTGVK